MKNPPRHIILFFSFLLLSFNANGQDVSKLLSSLDTMQSPTQKLDTLIKITNLYPGENNLPIALEYCAKVFQLNKSIEQYDFWTMKAKFGENVITGNTNLDSLKLIVNSLDERIITGDFLNFVAERCYYFFYSDYTIELAQEALNLSEKTNDVCQMAFSYLIIAITNYYNDNVSDAIRDLKKAKKLFYSIEDIEGIMVSNTYLSKFYSSIYYLRNPKRG